MWLKCVGKKKIMSGVSYDGVDVERVHIEDGMVICRVIGEFVPITRKRNLNGHKCVLSDKRIRKKVGFAYHDSNYDWYH